MLDSFWLLVHRHESVWPVMLLAYILLARIWGVWVEEWIRTRIVGADSAPVKTALPISSPQSVGLRFDIRPAQAPSQRIAGLRA